MKKLNKIRLFVSALLPCLCFFTPAGANDSTKILSQETFLQIVKKYNPAAKLAAIGIEKAQASLISSRSGFDPLIVGGSNEKTFDGINYYRSNGVQLNIPSWYGIEVQTGIEYLSGNRTDPMETAGKTSFTGISIPLAKNLLMDKRRATLLQAKIMVQASEQEKRNMLNDILLEAAEAYWQWVQSYLVYKTYINVIEVNKKRLALVTIAFQNGERPAIDTTEALTQLQQFEYLQNDALLDFKNATVVLSGFLWKENDQPYDLPGDVWPGKRTEELFDAVNFPELEKIIDDAKQNHPLLNLYTYKLKSLHLEKKLKFQELLPKLDLKYNQLSKGFDIASVTTKNLFENNYRFAISFNMPLRISQGRGEYKMAKIKITETKLQQSLKEINITNKVKSYYNQLVNYRMQVSLLQKTYTNYLRLQKGEETRFFNGESNLFLVNNRENKTLETFVKLVEVAVKYNKSSVTLQWAAGRLWEY